MPSPDISSRQITVMTRSQPRLDRAYAGLQELVALVDGDAGAGGRFEVGHERGGEGGGGAESEAAVAGVDGHSRLGSRARLSPACGKNHDGEHRRGEKEPTRASAGGWAFRIRTSVHETVLGG